MEKVIRVFRSFAEADAANDEEYKKMTPEQRIEIVLRLREQVYPNAAKEVLQRVSRVTKLERS